MIRLRYGVFAPMVDSIAPASSNSVTVDHFEITPDTFQGFQCGDRITPGRHARLSIGGAVVMSDTDYEMRTNIAAVKAAKGDVLIGGLGLGMIVMPIASKLTVRSVTVIERNKDVIACIEPSLRRSMNGTSDKVSIVHGDVFAWKPERAGRQFDFIYFDIWTDCCVDDVKPRTALHVKYRRYLRVGGKVTSWEYDHLRYLARNGRWR